MANRTRVSRAELSRRGRQEFGLPVTDTWRTANYAYPRGAGGDRGKRPSYPIDPAHVRAARSLSARSDTAGSLSTVDAALRARYGSVDMALAAARRSAAARTGAGSTHRRAASRRGGAAARRATSR